MFEYIDHSFLTVFIILILFVETARGLVRLFFHIDKFLLNTLFRCV